MAQLTEKALRKYVQEDPQSTLFAWYADLLLDQDRVDQAYLLCIQGMKAHPKFATGWLILGKAAFRRGERTFAKRCWMNALAADKMCLHAARLLLTTEELHLTLKEAHTAAVALLNVDRNHLLARATMQLIHKRRKTESGEKKRGRESDVTAGSHRGKSERDPRPSKEPALGEGQHLTKFDLYGKDKQHLRELVDTIEQVKSGQSADRNHRAVPDQQQEPAVPEAEREDKVHSSEELLEHLDDALETGAGTGQSGEDALPEEDTIPAKMATLTFVRVLKAQGLYENALSVLKMIPPEASNRAEIAREQRELTRLLETQEN